VTPDSIKNSASLSSGKKRKKRKEREASSGSRAKKKEGTLSGRQEKRPQKKTKFVGKNRPHHHCSPQDGVKKGGRQFPDISKSLNLREC